MSVQNAMCVDDFSEPKPDISVCKPLEELFGAFIPDTGDVFFLVEISDTSIRYDTRIKIPFYAQAGIPEYWKGFGDRRRLPPNFKSEYQLQRELKLP